MENFNPSTASAVGSGAIGTALSVHDANTLRSTAKWGRFLSILGMIMVGLMVLMSLFAGTFMAAMMSMGGGMNGAPVGMLTTTYTVIFLITAAIYFVPSLLLYQFSTRTLRALDGGFDQAQFSNGLQAHRRMYKFMGVLMIIVLGLYALGFLFAIVGGLAGAAMM